MSFSKARIQRFNELPSEAPPPGAYDPKFDVKVKGSVIEKKTGRFNDAKSSGSCECSASVSSRSTSNASAKKFRTPLVPKKKVRATCSRVKTKSNNETKDQQDSTYDPQQELADLKVECANKDKTILEYEKHIEDMKAEIRELNEKYNKLQEQFSEREEQYKEDIDSMFQLPCNLLGQEVEVGLDSDNEVTIREEVTDLDHDFNSYAEQQTFVRNMSKIEAATKELNIMTEHYKESMNLKDIQIIDIFNLQTETERKLENVQTELKKSEKQVEELQSELETIQKLNKTQDAAINQKLIDNMTDVLQNYFDFDNLGGKWNIEHESFPHEIKQFLNKIKQFATDLKIHFEREIELSRDNFNEERENLEQELEIKRILVTNLENKLAESNETNLFLTEELKDVQNLYKDINQTVVGLKEELELANERYAETIKAHKTEMELIKCIHLEEQSKLNNLLEEARSNYLIELDNITKARNKELLEVRQLMENRIEDEKKRMKDCTNKIVENAEAITRETLSACRVESEEKIRKVISETDAKISLIKKASEEELRLATENYNERLEQLEKDKVSLNSDLAQRDLEIIQLNAALEEMKCTVETQESFSQSLQDELDRVEAELVEKKEELRNLKDQIRNESSEMVARKRRLELVMAENQASVAALSCRLAQSENEVERLQQELQSKEGSLLGCQELLDNITKKSKIVQEQLDSITGSIDRKMEFMNQIEMRCVNDINDAKTMFTNKIDNLKNITVDELKQSQLECKIKTEYNAELKASLKQMSDRLDEATNMLLKMEEINDEKSIEFSKLQLQNAKLHQELDNKDQIIKENKVSFEKEIQQYKTEIKELKEQATILKTDLKELEIKKCELEEKKYDFEELEIAYEEKLDVLKSNVENERTQREKLEQQIRQFEKTVEQLNDECKQVTEKYSELVGHNNHKQRIKHVSQLKEKINVQQIDLLRLRQELDTKNNVIDELRQANEKLKVEERRQFGLGKENLHAVISSPHKSLFPKSANTTPVSSPHKPLTPLRDRNE